jgi:uncharacterized protein (TIGR02284 family)
MEIEKTIDALNTLIQINNDRIEGYETASKETEEIDLKTFFGTLTKTSLHCKQELAHEVTQLGGTPTEDTKTTGKFFRVWMDVKAALTGKNRKAILNSCEYGEDMALETYKKILSDETEYLTPALITIIETQHALLIADHNNVKSMRNSLVEQD